MAVCALAQDNITGMQWWIDSDYANNQFQTITPEMTFEGSIPVPVASLPEGRHHLYFRFRSHEGKWSPILIKRFVSTSAGKAHTMMESVEYWFDGDPSTRKTHPLTPQHNLNDNLALEMNNLQTGRHSIHVRLKNTNGEYSPILTQRMTKTPEGDSLVHIAACEYWIDNDFYNRKLHIFQEQKDTLDTTFGLDLTTFGKGSCVLSLLFLDNLGNPTNVIKRYIYNNPVGAESNYIAGYRYWFDDSGGAPIKRIFSGVQNPRETTLSIPVDQYEDGDTAIVHLQFKDAIGQWSPSVVDTFVFNLPVKLDQHLAERNQLLAYPNPVSDNLRIAIPEKAGDANLTLELFDALGKLVWVKKIKIENHSYFDVDVSGVKSGAYYIRIITGVGIYAKQIIVE